jgi:hypothetical protein
MGLTFTLKKHTHLDKEEPVDVEPEDGREVDCHGHDAEQTLIEHELVHQVRVNVQDDEQSELWRKGNVE